MAITPPVIFAALQANRAAMAGTGFDLMAQGIAQGVAAWAISQPANLALTGFATGLAGAGTLAPGPTRLVVTPNAALVQGGLTSAGMTGAMAPSLAATIAAGIAQAFTTAGQYTMLVVAGVGVGSDVSRITIANPATLAAALTAALTGSYGGGGPALPMLAQGLAMGITSLLLTGTGLGVVTGATTYPPSAATVPTFSVVI